MSEQLKLFAPPECVWIEAIWRRVAPEMRREIVSILAEIGRQAVYGNRAARRARKEAASHES